MALKIGIVGLPNVGKSTLFNALTGTRSADAQNYPFCTIDPNVGIVEVPDHRLDKLAQTMSSEKVIPTAIEFVDIAGLVKGASAGEGLGNKFLSNIRECNAIGHVIRVFDDPNIIHVHGEVNPQNDREVIESELILADLQTLEKRYEKAVSEAKSGNAEKKKYVALLEKVARGMESGVMAADLDLSDEEKFQLRDLHLLTIKPSVYIVNLPEEQLAELDRPSLAQKLNVQDHNKVIPVCAKLEQELADLSLEESVEYLESLGVTDSGFNSLIRAAYETLGLITYFTAGPKETRAWTVKRDATAPQAAGVIHTDFEKGFIKADVAHWEDYVTAGGDVKAKERGLMRLEGKDYIVKDGDVMYFKFSS